MGQALWAIGAAYLTTACRTLSLFLQLNVLNMQIRLYKQFNLKLIIRRYFFPTPFPLAILKGFPLARRIGHPYQQRTPPKRKKPRTSFTRLQVILFSYFSSSLFRALNQELVKKPLKNDDETLPMFLFCNFE